jgi:peroxiredoxin
MKSLEENYDAFEKFNTIAFGIGVDSVPCNKAWAKSLGIEKTSLLSDFWPHGGVASLYDVFRSKDGYSERANIILDENGTVVFVKVYPLDQLPDINEVLELCRTISSI